MDKSTKAYKRAVDEYNNGNIDRAISLCEKSISINTKNSAAINLKGLLYYIKGDLDGAQKLWKMNININHDSVSEKYYKDSKKDEIRFKYFFEAVKFSEEMHINESLELLKKCNESDYNSINVNNHMAICYMRQGEYDNAVDCVKKVYSIDKKNQIAANTMKEMIKVGVVKKQVNYRVIVTFILALVIFIFIFCILMKFGPSTYKSINKFLNKKNNTLTLPMPIIKNATNDNNNNNNNKEILEKNSLTENKFPGEDLNKFIISKDYDNIYEIYSKWKDSKIEINDKVILNKALESVKTGGIEYFYNTGYKNLKNGDNSAAKIMLQKAYNEGKENYLFSEIIFTLGIVNEKLGAVDKALNLYLEYDEKFKNSTYSDITLYNIALIYDSIGQKDKAQEFAKKIGNNFPNSIYNNNRIKGFIK